MKNKKKLHSICGMLHVFYNIFLLLLLYKQSKSNFTILVIVILMIYVCKNNINLWCKRKNQFACLYCYGECFHLLSIMKFQVSINESDKILQFENNSIIRQRRRAQLIFIIYGSYRVLVPLGKGFLQTSKFVVAIFC